MCHFVAQLLPYLITTRLARRVAPMLSYHDFPDPSYFSVNFCPFFTIFRTRGDRLLRLPPFESPSPPSSVHIRPVHLTPPQQLKNGPYKNLYGPPYTAASTVSVQAVQNCACIRQT